MQGEIYNVYIHPMGWSVNKENEEKIEKILEPWTVTEKYYYKSNEMLEHKELIDFLSRKVYEDFGERLPILQISITKNRVMQENITTMRCMPLKHGQVQTEQSFVIPKYKLDEAPQDHRIYDSITRRFLPPYVQKYELVQIPSEGVYDDFKTHAEKHFKQIKQMFEKQGANKKQKSSD
jgi:hypothetical protein